MRFRRTARSAPRGRPRGAAMLARLRFAVERSRGGRYPEPEHPYRNAFQRDRDRIVHSLGLPAAGGQNPGLHIRSPPIISATRLTHTIEVGGPDGAHRGQGAGADEDLTEALALAHDIGPPRSRTPARRS